MSDSPEQDLPISSERGAAYSQAPGNQEEKLHVPKGFSAPILDRADRKLNLESYLTKSPDSTFYMRVSGDSMHDAGIREGDLVVVDRSVVPVDGNVVVAIVEGEFTVKRLAKDARGAPVLRSEQAGRKDIPILAGDELVIWGVVKWSIHKI